MASEPLDMTLRQWNGYAHAFGDGLSFRITHSDIEGIYSLVCFEYDIVSQGRSIAEAMSRWEETFKAYVAHDVDADRVPLEKVGPPPVEVLAAWVVDNG